MRTIVVLMSLMCGLATVVLASVPTQMNVQGRLLNAGSPMNGAHPTTFKIFDALTGGTQLWTEDDTVSVLNGIYSTVIGTKSPLGLAVFSGQPRWLEVIVDGATLSPRLSFDANAYSFRAQRADTADVALSGSSGNELWSTDGPNVWRGTGNVGIGTSAPLHPLEAHTTSPGQVGFLHSLSTSGTNYGIDAGAQGVGATTNIGGYFYASGAANNYALIVPSGYGKVGIGTGAPAYQLDVHSIEPTQGLNWTVDYGTEIGSYVRFGSNNARGALFIGNANVGGSFGPDEAAILQTTGGWQWTKQLNIMGHVGIGTNSPDPTQALYVVGNMCVTGAKNRIVHDEKFGDLYYNAVESDYATFTSSGRSVLKDGKCHVDLDPRWLAGVTIDSQCPLDVTSIVFYGRHGDWYATPGMTGFDVADPSGGNAEFFWSVQARQRGYEALNLNRPEQTAASQGR